MIICFTFFPNLPCPSGALLFPPDFLAFGNEGTGTNSDVFQYSPGVLKWNILPIFLFKEVFLFVPDKDAALDAPDE